MQIFGPFLPGSVSEIFDGEYGSLAPISALLDDDDNYAVFEEQGAGSIYHDKRIRLVIDGVEQGDNKAPGDMICGFDIISDVISSYGGDNDKWGINPTREQINSGDFGVVVQVAGGGDTPRNTLKFQGFNVNLPESKIPVGFRLDCKWYSTIGPMLLGQEGRIETIFFNCIKFYVFAE